MTHSGFLPFCLLLLLSVGSAPAQEPPERLLLLTRYEVDLADDASFREYLRLRVRAAREAGLASEHGWTTLRTDNTWLVLQPIPSMTALHEPDLLLHHVRGTPGEATLRAAGEALAGVHYTTESRVLAAPRAWRYDPPNAAPANYAFVQEFRVRPGAEREYEGAREEFVAFLREIGLPYRYDSFRTRVGKGVVVGIVWPDDLVRYYTAFSPAVFLQKYPQRFPPLSRRLRGSLTDMETSLYSVLHEESYSSR